MRTTATFRMAGALTLLVAGMSSATIINVPADYATIQAAVNAAAPSGDTIIVAAGTYQERLVINKSVDLRGAQYGVAPNPSGARTNPVAESVITEAGLSTPNPDVLVEIPSGVTGVTIDGFTLNGDQTNTTADTSVVRCWGSDVTIRNDIIDGMFGVIFKGGTNLAASRNRVKVNKAGVVVQPNPASNVTVSDSMFSMGTTPQPDPTAIYLATSSNCSVTGNDARGFVVGTAGRALQGSGVSQLIVSDNVFTGNRDGISIFGASTFITITDNNLSNNARYGINIKGQDISITGNAIRNNSTAGIFIDKNVFDTQRVAVHSNDISSNAAGLQIGTTAATAETVNAENNWWGSASGPNDPSNDAGETTEVPPCTATPAAEINVDGAGNAVIDTSTRAVDYCPWLSAAATLKLTFDKACYKPGDTVTATLSMKDLGSAAAGFQAFLNYDTSRLTFTGSWTYTPTPFGLPVINTLSGCEVPDACVNPSAGVLNFASGINQLASQTPSSADADLVTFTFTVSGPDNCSIGSLLTFRSHTPPTTLTDIAGAPLLPLTTIDAPAITIDGTPPTVTAGSIASCYDTQALAEAAAIAATTATDNCGTPVKTVSTSGTCNAVITVTATDCAGNTASVTYNTRIDNTTPSITCSANVTTPADAGLCSAALATAIDFESGGFTLAADGAGSSTLSTALSLSPTQAADLKLPSGSTDFAKVIVPTSGLKLGTTSGLFQTNIVPGSAPNLAPYMYFGIDTNGNHVFDFGGPGGGDSFVIAFITGGGAYPQGCWFTQGLNGATNIHVVGNRTGLGATEFSSSAGGGLLSALRTTILSGSTTWGDIEILQVRVGAGEWPGAGSFEAYVDDILIGKYLEVPPASTDDCGSLITGVRSDALPLTDPYPVGTTTITWTATDCCGHSTNCAQTVTVEDHQNPVITCPPTATVECAPATLTIAGTHTVPDANVHPINGNYRPFKIDTSHLFRLGPPYGPVVVTGSVNISTLLNNSSVYVGLMAKDRYDAWVAANIPGGNDPNNSVSGFFGFIDTAYAACNTGSSGRMGLGQQLSFGSTTQTYVASGIGLSMSGFKLTLNTSNMSLKYGANTVSQNYANHFDYPYWYTHGFSGNPTVPTDWTNGAYAFVGTFFDKKGGAPAINVTFSQGTIPDPSVTGTATATDNCDPSPVITYTDSVAAGSCAQGLVITRTWKATDIYGNESTCVQTINVHDTTPPVIATCPANISVNADAGLCTATVSPGLATATDNCDTAPVVTWVREDGQVTLTAPFSSSFAGSLGTGVTKITWTATDACGNVSLPCTQTVTVSGYNELKVSVQLRGSGFPASLARCITFELWNCPGSTPTVVNEVLTFVSGLASNAVVLVPCGPYNCITARDKLHTLRRTDSDDFGVQGTQYVSDFTNKAPAFDDDSLIGGNLNDNAYNVYIDILDFGVFAGQFLVNYGTGNTTCSTAFPHADLSGNGTVFSEDFTFIQQNFLKSQEANCCGAANFAVVANFEAGPRSSITVAELNSLGLSNLTVADLNRDKVVDSKDIALWIKGVRPAK